MQYRSIFHIALRNQTVVYDYTAKKNIAFLTTELLASLVYTARNQSKLKEYKNLLANIIVLEVLSQLKCKTQT